MLDKIICFILYQGDDLHVSCYYIDCNLNAFAISSAQVCLMFICNELSTISGFLINYCSYWTFKYLLISILIVLNTAWDRTELNWESLVLI